MKKKLMFLVIAMMILNVTPMSLHSQTAKDMAGYVKIVVEYNEEYLEKGQGATARKALADEVFAKSYSTLKEANEAFAKLYSRNQDGNYTATYTDHRGNSTTYTNANPFYYNSNYYNGNTEVDKTQGKIDLCPIKSVTYEVYGKVDQGNVPTDYKEHLGNGQIFRINDVKLIGKTSDATLLNASRILTYIAGGDDNWFVDSGTFVVKDLLFDGVSENNSISITTYASVSTPSTKMARNTNLIIDNCRFHNQLYIYTNDLSTIERNLTITNCVFDGLNKVNNYAILIQSAPTTDSSKTAKLKITNNVIQNYDRGINVQEQRSETDVEISNNTINNLYSDEGRGAIQITACKNILIENNLITNVKRNVFRVHELAKDVVKKVVFKGNTVKDSGYILWNEKEVLGADAIYFEKNVIENVDILHSWNKDVVGENKEINMSKVTGDLYDRYVSFMNDNGSLIKEEKVMYLENVSKPATPIKSGYTFGGWYVDKECTKAYDFTTKIEKNMTLYVKWNPIGVNDEENLDADDSLSKVVGNIVDAIQKGETIGVSKETAKKVQVAIENGEIINVEVILSTLKENEIDKEEQKEITTVIDKKELDVLKFFDLALILKSNESGILGTLNELTDAITIELKLDKADIKEGRQYYIVRYHDGKTTILDTTLKDGVLSFETDQFSTYALAYTDKKIENQTSINNVDKPNNVNTKDVTDRAMLYGLMGISLVFMMGVVVLKKWDKVK